MEAATAYNKLNILQVVREEECYREVVAELDAYRGEYVLVWMIADQKLTRFWVRILAGTSICRIFVYDGYTCFAFPYEEPRPIERFYYKEALGREEKNIILRSLMVLCMTEKIPETLLYHLLTQRRIMLTSDRNLHFGYDIALDQSFVEHGEADCVSKCAELILELMDSQDSSEKKDRSLLEKRYARGGYQKWFDLYRDVQVVTAEVKKKKIIDIVKKAALSKKEIFLRIFFTFCVVLVAVTLIIILSQGLTGKIPLFNLFTKSFENIGTESLLK